MEMIQYRGAYRFADRVALDNAVASALETHTEWRPQFSAIGNSLRIVLDLPSRQSLAAAQVMQRLACSAVEGIVVARHRELAIDVFYAAS